MIEYYRSYTLALLSIIVITVAELFYDYNVATNFLVDCLLKNHV